MRHYTFAQKLCIKRAGLAMQRADALWPGCRVGIAISGGVDSFVLLKVMQIRKAILPFGMDIMALHLNPGFEPVAHSRLLPWLAANGIAAHIEITDFGPVSHSSQNRKKSPCFYCAWQRRKRLFDLCRKYRLTHLALGHNADDLAATFLLNLFNNASVRGMSICEPFFAGALRLIRPLLLVEKKFIVQAARQWDLPYWQNSCPSAGKTSRSKMEAFIDSLNAAQPGARKSVINALGRWQLQKDSPNQS